MEKEMEERIKGLLRRNDTKMVMCVLDGLGGLPVGERGGKTELETAATPNMDRLAREGAVGLHVPVARGITPGSGAAHLALFGYDPLRYEIGRGVLEALGLGIEMTSRNVAVRGNFSTVKYVDDKPVLVDRRAGRIPTLENRRIASGIQAAIPEVDGVKVSITSGMEHRFALVLTFDDPLPDGADAVIDTDPQSEGVSPLSPEPKTREAERVAIVLDKYVHEATALIRDEERANYMLLRGAARYPNLAGYGENYGLKAAAIAAYPMYRGVAKLVGMDVLDVAEGGAIEDEIEAMARAYEDYDFFYLHVKKTDSYGEDGDFDAKVGVIEAFDRLVPSILGLNPDILVVTGDHSTPSVMRAHSWHPVPFLLHSGLARGGGGAEFSEPGCLRGELGVFRAVEIMPLMLAHAGRLQKYGA